MGSDAGRVLTGFIALPAACYPDSVRVRTAWHEIGRQLSALPGVRGAALTNNLPVNGGVSGGVAIEGLTFRPGSGDLLRLVMRQGMALLLASVALLATAILAVRAAKYGCAGGAATRLGRAAAAKASPPARPR